MLGRQHRYNIRLRDTNHSYIETKELKKRVRDVIDPKRDLGHVDGKKSMYPFQRCSLSSLYIIFHML
jgi:hypothetical protein